MKKQFFSIGVYREILRQIKLIGISFTAALVLLAVICVCANMSSDNSVTLVELEWFAPIMIMSMYVFGIWMVSSAFSFLRKRSASDFYYSMPVSRTAFYTSASLAITTYVVIAIAAGCIAICLTCLFTGVLFNFALVLPFFLTLISSCALIISISLVSASITGTSLMYLIGIAIIMFLPRAVFMVIADSITSKFGSIANYSILFNPEFNLPASFLPLSEILGNYAFDGFPSYINVGASIYCFGHATLMWFAGLLFFKKRKAEVADIAASSSLSQLFFRCMLPMPFLLALVAIAYRSTLTLFILLALSIITFVLYELITTRNAKKLIKALPTYAICIVLALIIGTSIGIVEDRNEKFLQTPVMADDIRYFTLGKDSLFTSVLSKTALEISEIRFDDSDETMMQLVAQGITRQKQSDVSYTSKNEVLTGVNVNAVLKSGRRISCMIYLNDIDAEKFFAQLNQKAEYKEIVSKRLAPEDIRAVFIDDRNRLTKEQRQELLNCLFEEYSALSDADIIKINADNANTSAASFVTGDINGEVYTENPDVAYSYRGAITPILLYGIDGHDYFCQKIDYLRWLPNTMSMYMRMINDWNAKADTIDSAEPDYDMQRFAKVLQDLKGIEQGNLKVEYFRIDIEIYEDAKCVNEYSYNYDSSDIVYEAADEYVSQENELNDEILTLLQRLKYADTDNPKSFVRIVVNSVVIDVDTGYANVYYADSFIDSDNDDLKALVELCTKE